MTAIATSPVASSASSTLSRLAPRAGSHVGFGEVPEGELRALAAELRARVRGEVRFDDGSRALYATDGSNYRQIPIGVVIPRDVEDIIETVAVCRRYGAPILPRGGGTSLAGQCCNVAVVIDTSKYLRRILQLDPDQKLAIVEPGVVCDQLKQATEAHRLVLPPDPATHAWCTIGGMIGNDSCGPHSILSDKTGRMVDHVEELEVLTYDGLRLRVGRTSDEELQRIIAEGGRRGSIYAKLKRLRDTYAAQIRERFPQLPRRVSGYNLDELLPENGFNVAGALVGTEGTCVIVLGATVRLVHSPPARALAVIGYPSIFEAGDHVPEIVQTGPVALEAIDHRFVRNLWRKGLLHREISLLPGIEQTGGVESGGDTQHGTGGWLVVEYGGETPEEARDRAEQLVTSLRNRRDRLHLQVFASPEQQAAIWTVRDSGLGADADVPGEPENWEGWEDSAVPPERLGRYLRDLKQLMDRYGYLGTLYGHFGQGCVHTRLTFDLRTEQGIEKYHFFISEAAHLVVSHGGSLSGEHGDGQSRAEFLPVMYGEELVRAFGEFKAIWDPAGKMNPGKVVAPYRITENLRLGTAYNPPHLKTYFQFPADQFDFAQATVRCVGVGKCRDVTTSQEKGQTMCPSYMVTLEEKHSTRGRARLLFELLQGQAITGGWRDRHVKEALDLCLSCKGCKGDCPVHVDMATYKAEFLAHYYTGRLRPRSAYAMGLIHRWARLATTSPALALLANLATHAPGLSQLAKRAAGIAPQRQLPAFAAEPFTVWFERREHARSAAGPVAVAAQGEDQKTVILWPDTFSNYFFPEVAKAAVEVLEALGYRVRVPASRSLCCGRPLYDYGFLEQAQGLLRQILRALGPEIQAGVPVVGLEPSCIAVFRDELTNLFPHDQQALRLSRQSLLFDEFVAQHLDSAQREAPRSSGEGGAHQHHQQTNGEQGRLPPLRRKALVHGHCHQKALMRMEATERVLQQLGLDFEVVPSGCCGMAGSFGFEEGEHYDVSIKAGERVLLPAVRRADPQTLIIADGFSCREQIAQQTGRRALHLAQVLQLALYQQQGTAPGGADGRPIEDAILAPPAWPPAPEELRALAVRAAVAMAGAAGTAAALALARRARRS